MIKKCFIPVLPSEETIFKWNDTKDYLPGIHDTVLTYLVQYIKQEREKGRHMVFDLMFDEIHIKTHTFYNKNTHKYEGHVEFGGDLPNKSDDLKDDPLAKKALVFMLVNINGGYKVPVAYYLIDTLTAVEKSLLIKNLLCKLAAHDIDVVCLTFDGDSVNVAACELLGANLNYFRDKPNFRPYLINPFTNKIIYLFFDACHMLKLVRNYFGNGTVRIYSGKSIINWEFILKLHSKQELEGLHCACKVRRRHVYYHKEKMKVFLAAQLLSSSTAKALEFLQFEMEDPQFRLASSTSEFCQKINDIFDLLNNKNRFCKREGKRPIDKKNFSKIEKKVEEFIRYIENLDVIIPVKSHRKRKRNDENFDPNAEIKYVRKNVLDNHHTKTGFLGLIICLTSYINLSKFLLENNICDYVLSYKFSQDHLEMFFALIRRMGGFNNNPTTVQMKSAYKKLMLNKTCVLVSSKANCTPQDNTLLLTDGSNLENYENVTFGVSKKYYFDNTKKSKSVAVKTNSRKKKEKLPTIMKNKFEDLLGNKFQDYSKYEHNYFLKINDGWTASEYNTEMVKYMSGHVSFILKKKIHCQACIDLLSGEGNSEKAKLTKIKNKGGLTYASPEVEYICMTVEKVIRSFPALRKQNIYSKVMTETMQLLPRDILDDNIHVFDFEPLYDHRHSLILLVCQTYADIRLKWEGEKFNDVIERLRMHINKNTIFQESNAIKNGKNSLNKSN